MFKAITLSVLISLAINQFSFADEHAHGEEKRTISLTEKAFADSKIEIRKATEQTLHEILRVNGRVSPNSSSVAHIAPRFSGIIREVKKDIGDSVQADETLAIVESNQNLQRFEVRALQAGTITDRHATIGESIKEDEPLFVVIDLSQLWAEFTIFQHDIDKVKLGQSVSIQIAGHPTAFESSISFISPVVDETTQSRIARATLHNPPSAVAPGAYISGQIAINSYKAPLAITNESIQTIDGNPTVFIAHDFSFTGQPLVVGRADAHHTEVLSGLAEGANYAAVNTFILKAELQKQEAEHEH
jgi:membrane fusion protein, heavy metal efflux system